MDIEYILRYLHNNKRLLESYRTQIQSLLEEDIDDEHHSPRNDPSDSITKDDVDTAAELWQAITNCIPSLWERIKHESTISFQIEEKDVRVMYIQHQRGTRSTSRLTIDDKIRTGISELTLGEGYDQYEKDKGYLSTVDSYVLRLLDKETSAKNSFLEGRRGKCNVREYVQSVGFTKGSQDERTAITGARFGRKSLVSVRLLEEELHVRNKMIDGTGLQCLTSLAHQQWKAITIPKINDFIGILMKPSSKISISDNDGSSHMIHVLDFIQRVSLWYRGIYHDFQDTIRSQIGVCQSVATRKRPAYNYENTPASKKRREDPHNTGTGSGAIDNPTSTTSNYGIRSTNRSSSERESSPDPSVSTAGDAFSITASTSADPPNFYTHQSASNFNLQATCDGNFPEHRGSASQDTSCSSSANLLDNLSLGQTPFPIAESGSRELFSERPNHLCFHENETVARSDSSQDNDQQDRDELNNADANAAQILSEISYTSHSVNVPTHSVRGSSDHDSESLWYRPSLAAENNSSNPSTFPPQSHPTTSNTTDDQHRNHATSEAANNSFISQQTATSYAFQHSLPTTLHDSMMNQYSIPTTLHDSMMNQYSIPTTLHDSMVNQYSIPTTLHDSMVDQYSIPTTLHDSMVNQYSIPTTFHDSMVNQYGIPSLAITDQSNAWS